jgi:hypothetical protein
LVVLAVLFAAAARADDKTGCKPATIGTGQETVQVRR